MVGTRKHPLAQHAYSIIAEEYAARIDTKPHNAYYERPATLSLLPEVSGTDVLDAGCGPGVYAEWLVNHGARVVALDGSPKMVMLARRRLGDRARILKANLEAPLDFFADASFDIVISPLVMDYIADWLSTFNEYHRVLRSGGSLVFSAGHPFHEYDIRRQTSNYFNLEQVEYTWRGFGKAVTMPYYRRPLSAMIDPLLQAGFILDKILEPLPLEAFKQSEPEDYTQLTRSPGLICLRAIKGTTV